MGLRTILYVNASHLDGLCFLSVAKKTLKSKGILALYILFLSKKKKSANVYDFGMTAYVVKQIEVFRVIMNVLPLFRGCDHE